MDRLSVLKLFEKVYARLGDRNSHQDIALPDGTFSYFPDEYDPNGAHKGRMLYDEAEIFRLGVMEWGVAIGRRPQDEFSSDEFRYMNSILAVDLQAAGRTEGQIREELAGKIKDGFLPSSVLVGTTAGTIYLPETSIFRRKMNEAINASPMDFVLQRAKTSRDIREGGRDNRVLSRALYRPEFADFLAEAAEGVLRDFPMVPGEARPAYS